MFQDQTRGVSIPLKSCDYMSLFCSPVYKRRGQSGCPCEQGPDDSLFMDGEKRIGDIDPCGSSSGRQMLR